MSAFPTVGIDYSARGPGLQKFFNNFFFHKIKLLVKFATSLLALLAGGKLSENSFSWLNLPSQIGIFSPKRVIA